jgi:hypothetical protein
MSTPLVTTLRESCDYLRDVGYHQTAQLMTMAADEIERLKRRIEALESASPPATALRNCSGTPHRIAGPDRPTMPCAGS